MAPQVQPAKQGSRAHAQEKKDTRARTLAAPMELLKRVALRNSIWTHSTPKTENRETF
jgi:hypothetical protein